MCNYDISTERWFFEAIDSSCGDKHGLGPGVCKYYYYMRFYHGQDGKRQRHSNLAFYSMALPGAILFPIISSVVLIAYTFIWTYRGTKDIFSKCSIFLYFLAIIVAPLLWAFLILWVVVIEICIVGVGKHWWTAYGGICRYSKLPAVRYKKSN